MNQAENKILNKENLNNTEIQINYKVKYSDAFYEQYIANFEPNKKSKWIYCFIKRTFDIFVSFVCITILLIPFLIIGIIIKCDSKGPMIFKNRRVGKNGRIFNCLKFRSMSKEAPAEVATSLDSTDLYITRVGKFLRKTSIDELPQLFNVLVGQMSLIGYRPLVPTEEKCNKMREQLGVFSMRPGISGYSQVKGRDDVYYKNKAIMDAYYVKNASIGFDIKLLFSSVFVVLGGKSNWDKTSKEKNRDCEDK